MVTCARTYSPAANLGPPLPPALPQLEQSPASSPQKAPHQLGQPQMARWMEEHGLLAHQRLTYHTWSTGRSHSQQRYRAVVHQAQFKTTILSTKAVRMQ